MKWPLLKLSSLILAIGVSFWCSRSDVPSSESTLLINGPDGGLSLSSNYYPTLEDVPGCFEVISHTNGSGVFDSLWLMMCVYNVSEPGSELSLERVSFSAALSSDSDNYTDSFTGKMILIERSDTRVVIRMEDVHFKISHGEYTLNGDLVATLK